MPGLLGRQMRIYHPDHGILFTTDQTEIDRLISTGGYEFDINEKPWIKEETFAEIMTEAVAAYEEGILRVREPITHTPKRGRPAKHGNH